MESTSRARVQIIEAGVLECDSGAFRLRESDAGREIHSKEKDSD